MDKEYEIILQLSRLSGEINAKRVEELLSEKVNWEKLIASASKNKVLSLVYHNLNKTKMSDYLPKQYKILLEDNCSCNFLRNEEKLSVLEEIQQEALKQRIPFAPVKGGYLIDNVYKDRRIRTTNDIDILIRKNDITHIDEIMKKYGFVSGEYDQKNNKIIRPDKTKMMLYKTKMYNLLPYVRVEENKANKAIIFDFSFALDFSLNTEPVTEMLNSAEMNKNVMNLRPEHHLVHMCCHHYREASNVAWILLGKDLTLMKFCDVREFICNKMDKNSIKEAIKFVKKYNLQKAMYFTIYFVREIYNDGYETDILNELDIYDESFLYQFGENDYEKVQMRKKDFWTSIFAIDNKDEVIEKPKYKTIL